MIDINTDIDLSLDKPAKTCRHIQAFIRKKLEESDCKKAIVGLSGGLDSSLVASLATRSLDSEKVLAMLMPDRETGQEDINQARLVASHLSIKAKTIPIDHIFQSVLHLIPEAKENRMAEGNLKARIRMSLLYLFSNLEKGLVLGTGNKSELLLGYFTKHGDGAADILPLGKLYKVQVRELANYLNIPRSIIKKPPSAGFWPGQTDREELGAKYDLIDPILHCLVELKLSARETAQKLSVEIELVKNLESRWKKSRHKRKPPPFPNLNFE